MKVATFHVNGVNGRLPVLLRWLAEASLASLSAGVESAGREISAARNRKVGGYGAIWHCQKAWNGVAILAKGADPVETRRGLPGDPNDLSSGYIDAAVRGLIVGCLYLSNGNPAPGPKFDGKLDWFRRLHEYTTELLVLKVPVVLAGDCNVIPTDLDVYVPERWRDDALFRPEVREGLSARYVKCTAGAGKAPVVTTVIVRELAGFIWAIG